MKQSETLDFGIYGHQVRVAPNNRLAILVTRGNDPTNSTPEDPGALKVFSHKDGLLTKEASIAPNGGYGFRSPPPRFPSRAGRGCTCRSSGRTRCTSTGWDGDALSSEAIYKKDTLANPDTIISRQAAGTVHVHPNGRFLYGVNRADTTREFEGRNVFVGGENTLAVYSIDQSTGEPTPIQHIETRGIHCRTFHIDPSGRMLVAAHNVPVLVRDGAGVKTGPACSRCSASAPMAGSSSCASTTSTRATRSCSWMGMVPL